MTAPIDSRIAEAVAPAYERSAVQPSRDGMAILEAAHERERDPNARRGLETIFENIRRAVHLARRAGLDMTYICGEYPDAWPTTRANYQAWAAAANETHREGT